MEVPLIVVEVRNSAAIAKAHEKLREARVSEDTLEKRSMLSTVSHPQSALSLSFLSNKRKEVAVEGQCLSSNWGKEQDKALS